MGQIIDILAQKKGTRKAEPKYQITEPFDQVNLEPVCIMGNN